MTETFRSWLALEAEVKVSQGHTPSEVPGENNVLASASLWLLLVCLGLWLHLSDLQGSIFTLPAVSVCFSLSNVSGSLLQGHGHVIMLRPSQIIQDHLPSLDPSSLQSFLFFLFF